MPMTTDPVTMKTCKCRLVSVFAHGTGGNLIVADGAHHASPGRFQRAFGDPDDRQQDTAK